MMSCHYPLAIFSCEKWVWKHKPPFKGGTSQTLETPQAFVFCVSVNNQSMETKKSFAPSYLAAGQLCCLH